MGQPLILHDGNDEGIIGQQSMKATEIRSTGDHGPVDRENGDGDSLKIINGLPILAELLHLDGVTAEPVGMPVIGR
jgi:hypothetical protein